MSRRVQGPGHPWPIRLYVAVVTLTAVVVAWATAVLVRSGSSAPPLVVPVLIVLVVQSELLRITYKYRDNVENFTLIETALAPLVAAAQASGGPA